MAGRPRTRGRTEKPPAGVPGHGPAKGVGKGPATGMGWGGPSKNAIAREMAEKGEEIRPQYLADGEPLGEDRLALKRRRSLHMERIIFEVAEQGSHESIRIQAAQKLYEIYNGKPIDRVIVDEQPIQNDVIDPAELSPEAREEMRAALERQKQKGVH